MQSNGKVKMTEEVIAYIVKITESCMKEMINIPVGVSNRHVHLSKKALETLFGKAYVLTVKKMLGQPGQFAAEEVVDIVGPKGQIERVRILGPTRRESQVEISRTDGFLLGVDAPVRESGKLENTPGIVLKGPEGEIKLDKGVIVAQRHIHLTHDVASLLNVRDGQMVEVDIPGMRGCRLRGVLVRVSDEYAPEMHVDTDEANALGIKNGDIVRIDS